MKNELLDGGFYKKHGVQKNNKTGPLISVLIVVFNGEQFLEEALLSVFNQTYSNIELIVMDGDSIDGTVDILKKFDDSIDYWLSEPDAGQSDAFNKGFSLCNGDLLTWLNADELYTPNAIKNIVEVFNNKPESKWLTGGIVLTDESLNISKMRMGEGGANILSKMHALNVYGASTFFTKEIFEKSGGMNLKLNFTMDTDLWWRFSLMGESFIRVNHYLCIFRMHENSKTANHVVTGSNKTPVHQHEIDRIFTLYGPNSKYLLALSKLSRNFFRLLSLDYIRSRADSIRFRDKNALKVFNINDS
jgi:glycosyltransferase involved in cell wall biosynthesis